MKKQENESRHTTIFVMNDGKKAVLRPIRKSDFKMEKEMFSRFSEETQRFRFFELINEVTDETIRRYTDINPAKESAMIAEVNEDGQKKMAGVARIISEDDHEKAEFAIVVADPWQKQGLGRKLIEIMIQIAHDRGVRKIYTYIMTDNFIMRKLLAENNFRLKELGDCVFAELEI